MSQSPEDPSGLVSRIQGWLLPDKDGNLTSPSKGSSPAISFLKQQNRSFFKQKNAGTLEDKVPIFLPSCTDSRAEEVLEFWLGGNMHTNYKTKWFPNGSADTQRRADEIIFSRFGGLFRSASNGELNEWKKDLKSSVALILVLDQFSRHIYRLQEVPADDSRRHTVDSLALTASEELTSKEGWDADLSVYEFVFSLMPFRHSPTTDRLEGVLASITAREGVEKDSMDLLLKFRKQTVRRLQHLQDIKKSAESDNILEQAAFTTDESDMHQCSIVASTEVFLRCHMKTLKSGSPLSLKSTPRKGPPSGQESPGVRASGFSIFKGPLPIDPIPEKCLAYLDNLEPVAISLSGGVDSMVIAKILVHLRHTERLAIGRIIATHIDYANREESGREAQFIRDWCAEMGIECHVRVVDEVTRGITGRDEYEKVSRDIRYEFYTQVLSATGCAGVIFGHHQGDVQENVISNVMRGSSPLSLSGMTAAGITNGVHVWRPLLSHPKSDILDFAHKYGVPYFRDTTPSWSTRGKLRTLLLPLLTDMYGEGCIRSLSALATESDETSELVSKNIYAPFLNSVKRLPCGLIIDISPYYYQPLCFWRHIFKELMHSLGMSMVRERSVKSFLERIQTRKFNVDIPYNAATGAGAGAGTVAGVTGDTFLPPPKSAIGWLELRKGFHTMLCEDGCLLIFRDGVISSSQSTNTNQLKNKDKDTNTTTTEDSSPLASPSVSPSTSPHPTNSHNSTQSWGRNVTGSTLDRIMTEDDADGKEVQGTFLTTNSDNKEHSSASASASAKLDNTRHSTALALAPPSHHWEEGIKFLISSLNYDTQAPVTISIGSWNVLISILTTESIEEHSSLDECTHGSRISGKSADINTKKKTEKSEKSNDVSGGERILQSVRTLLDGHFVYQLNVPEHCTHLSVPPSHMESGSSSSRSSNKETKKTKQSKIEKDKEAEGGEEVEKEEEEVYLEAAAFSKMDPRLRAGLPLFSPIVTKRSLSLDTNSRKTITLKLEYSHFYRNLSTTVIHA